MNVKNFFNDERGSVLPFVTIIVGLFALGFMALVIDAGILYVERKAMITSADAAALAGAEVLREYEYKEKSANYVNEAITKAQEYATKNGADSCQVTVSDDKKEVKVIVTKNEELFFARFLGHKNTDVKADAVATWYYVKETSFLPLFTFDVNYPKDQFDTTPITLHDKLSIDIDGEFDNGEPEKTNSYGFIAVGNGNNGMSTIVNAIENKVPVGPYTVDDVLESAPGNRNGALYNAVKNLIGQTFVMPIINLNEFKTDNISKKGLNPVNSWKLPVEFFAYFTITGVSHGNPATITGHFTGEKIESGIVGGTPTNPNPGGVPSATYSKLIK